MLKKLRRWLDERWSIKYCGCACFCKACGAVLQRRALRIEVDYHRPGAYIYFCVCGARSTFDHDLAPVPILTELMSEPSWRDDLDNLLACAGEAQWVEETDERLTALIEGLESRLDDCHKVADERAAEIVRLQSRLNGLT